MSKLYKIYPNGLAQLNDLEHTIYSRHLVNNYDNKTLYNYLTTCFSEDDFVILYFHQISSNVVRTEIKDGTERKSEDTIELHPSDAVTLLKKHDILTVANIQRPIVAKHSHGIVIKFRTSEYASLFKLMGNI